MLILKLDQASAGHGHASPHVYVHMTEHNTANPCASMTAELWRDIDVKTVTKARPFKEVRHSHSITSWFKIVKG